MGFIFFTYCLHSRVLTTMVAPVSKDSKLTEAANRIPRHPLLVVFVHVVRLGLY